ncbi:MAG: transposase [Alphaproteobacteria bacterium]
MAGSSAASFTCSRWGARWQDCPALYGPPPTIYNRFHRWARRGIWRHLFAALAATDPGSIQMIDSTTAKAHRSAAGGKRRPTSRRSVALAAGERQKSMLWSMVAAGPSRSK